MEVQGHFQARLFPSRKPSAPLSVFWTPFSGVGTVRAHLSGNPKPEWSPDLEPFLLQGPSHQHPALIPTKPAKPGASTLLPLPPMLDPPYSLRSPSDTHSLAPRPSVAPRSQLPSLMDKTLSHLDHPLPSLTSLPDHPQIGLLTLAGTCPALCDLWTFAPPRPPHGTPFLGSNTLPILRDPAWSCLVQEAFRGGLPAS